MRLERPGVGSAMSTAFVMLIVGGAAAIYVGYSGVLGPTGLSNRESSSTMTSTSITSTNLASSVTSHSITIPTSSSSSTAFATLTSSLTSQTLTSTSICTATFTSSIGTGTFGGPNFTSLFRTYSEMALVYNTTGNREMRTHVASEYSVVSTNATMTQVNITTSNGAPRGDIHYTAWLWKNGTAAAVEMEISGFKFQYSGSQAELYFHSAMSIFLMETVYSDPSIVSRLTSSQYVHMSGIGTVILGPTKVSYMNYTAKTLPLVITTCDSSSTFNKFFIQTGTIQGTQSPLVTQLIIKGSQTYNGYSQDLDFTLQMISLNKA